VKCAEAAMNMSGMSEALGFLDVIMFADMEPRGRFSGYTSHVRVDAE